jgi:AcrR family transcriptional regulator
VPRPYQLGQRQTTIDESRARMVEAAKTVLATSGRLTVDDVAREADVARATVYYQFGSKRGLLETLFDSLAAHGGLTDLPGVFQQAQALDALDAFIAAFTKFWTADRDVMRRLRGLAAIDAELGRVLDDRNNLRREGLRVLVDRIVAELGAPKTTSVDDAVDALHALTSFETFDELTRGRRRPPQVTILLQRLARCALGVAPDDAPPSTKKRSPR